MQVYVNIKSAGKRRNILTKKAYQLPDGIGSLREILSCFTRLEVEAFNQGLKENPYPVLELDKLVESVNMGKVSFGERRGEKQADLETALEVSLLAWQDGLVKVFLNDEELEELDREICLKEGDVLTFVRLTFLAGRMW